MAKDAVATMGTILTDDVGGRDAVHVAVIAVTAATTMVPGEHVVVDDTNAEPIMARPTAKKKDAIGIVDPFLPKNVNKGQRFWLYLLPRTITSLRHNWTHPAFEDAQETYFTPAQRAEAEAWARSWNKPASEAWLRNFCANNDCPSYETVMSVIKGESGRHNQWDEDYIHFDGMDAHGNIPDEFWKHVENILGHSVEKKAKYFSCSC